MTHEPTIDALSWYAIYTRSRHEKMINAQLSLKRIEAFLPLRKVRRRWSDRIKMIEEPLFGGYLFVRINPVEKREVLTVKGVVRFVSAGPRAVVIPEYNIHSIKTLIENNVDLEPYPYLQEGNRVVIKSGPLKDIEGFIVRKNVKNCQLVVSVNGILRSASMKIDASLVEKVD